MLGQIIIMNKEILYEILNSESETLSSTEIENIMNEELDKSTQDMDTDLIDLCLEALNTVDEEKLNKKKKKYRFGKIMVAAAIFIVIAGITIPVCAKHLNINIPKGIVTIYQEYFNIDISKNEYIDDIVGTLEHDGIEKVVLPKIVLNKDTDIYNYLYNNDTNAIIVNFDFTDKTIYGSVTIEKYNEYDFFSGKSDVSSDFENIEYINQNNIDILIFSNGDLSYINYTIEKTDYNIVLDSDFETACQIAKGI